MYPMVNAIYFTFICLCFYNVNSFDDISYDNENVYDINTILNMNGTWSAYSIQSIQKLHSAYPDSDIDDKIDIPRHLQKSANMSCERHNPTTCSMYPYIKYWNKKFKPADCYINPLRHPLKEKAPLTERKYVVFEPDQGGWNNIRMALEVVILFAIASGRTLVLPPKMKFYLLDKDNKGKKSNPHVSGIDSYYDLNKLLPHLDIIDMESFIQYIAYPGLLRLPYPRAIPVKDMAGSNNPLLWRYLELTCFHREWNPFSFFIGFNVVKDANGKGICADIPITNRIRAFSAYNRQLIPYSEIFHNQSVIYFSGDYRKEYRILTHFYSYLYFEDVFLEHVYKRLIRDRLHYRDEIFCAAGSIVQRIHADVTKLTGKPESPIVNKRTGGGKIPKPTSKYFQSSTTTTTTTTTDGQPGTRTLDTTGSDFKGTTKNQQYFHYPYATYYAYHIRRGDFQYHDTRISADTIWNNTKHLLNKDISPVIYISTDEKNRTFFKPFMDEFIIKFLDDYPIHYEDRQYNNQLNVNHAGMIEQIICANAHTFIGTPLSTFTGYITRMRGYYRDHRYANTYYFMPDSMYQLHQDATSIVFWSRESKLAFNNIDDDSPGHIEKQKNIKDFILI